MRDWFITQMWRGATALTVWLARRPRGRPALWSWTVGQGPRIGWAVFSPPASWAAPYHVWAVLEDDGECWLFDPGAGRVGVCRIGAPPERVPDLARRLNAYHLVEVRGVGREGVFVASPVSCATLTQTALGLWVPEAVTPERLLDYLWRHRHVGEH